MQAPTLTDAEVTVRPVRAEDSETIYALLSVSPEVCEWTRIPWPYTREDADTFVQTSLAAADGGSSVSLMILADGEIAGGTGVMRVGAEPKPRSSELVNEIGYWLYRDFRGRGIATRALRLVSRWSIGPLGLDIVRLQVHDGNDASRRVAERAGFTYVGVVEADEVVDDDHRSHRYELRAAD